MQPCRPDNVGVISVVVMVSTQGADKDVEIQVKQKRVAETHSGVCASGCCSKGSSALYFSAKNGKTFNSAHVDSSPDSCKTFAQPRICSSQCSHVMFVSKCQTDHPFSATENHLDLLAVNKEKSETHFLIDRPLGRN